MLKVRRLRVPALLATLAAIGLAPTGCASRGNVGSLRSESLGADPVVLEVDCETVVYAHSDRGDTSIFVSDIPADELLSGRARSGQVMHIELLWVPKAGATPMDASATNASIRHIIISEGEVGIYGGAGFAMPGGAPGRSRLEISLHDTSLRLLESTPGFTDPLTPARVMGSFTARLDPREARKLHRAISQYVTNALGTRRFVRAPDRRPLPALSSSVPGHGTSRDSG